MEILINLFELLVRDPVAIERSNLVNILKLVIREVIDSSLRFGRQLDSDHVPLQHFFIALEHVLRHGLKPKKVLWIFLFQREMKQNKKSICIKKFHPYFISFISSKVFWDRKKNYGTCSKASKRPTTKHQISRQA